MRPLKTDYPEYEHLYISKVEYDNFIDAMIMYKEETLDFFSRLDDISASEPYAENKWSPKEVLGHITDSERIVAYRALCIARGETKHLPGFDQDPYVKTAGFNEKNLSSLIAEFSSVRESNLLLFNSFSEDDFKKRGIANENEFTVLAFGFLIAGHNKHHLEALKSYYYKNL